MKFNLNSQVNAGKLGISDFVNHKEQKKCFLCGAFDCRVVVYTSRGCVIPSHKEFMKLVEQCYLLNNVLYIDFEDRCIAGCALKRAWQFYKSTPYFEEVEMWRGDSHSVKLRYVPAPYDSSIVKTEGWIRDLTLEGVEPNPGWESVCSLMLTYILHGMRLYSFELSMYSLEWFSLAWIAGLLFSGVFLIDSIGLSRTRSLFAFDGSQWFRDLTREGVEPNPGPPMSDTMYNKYKKEKKQKAQFSEFTRNNRKFLGVRSDNTFTVVKSKTRVVLHKPSVKLYSVISHSSLVNSKFSYAQVSKVVPINDDNKQLLGKTMITKTKCSFRERLQDSVSNVIGNIKYTKLVLDNTSMCEQVRKLRRKQTKVEKRLTIIANCAQFWVEKLTPVVLEGMFDVPIAISNETQSFIADIVSQVQSLKNGIVVDHNLKIPFFEELFNNFGAQFEDESTMQAIAVLSLSVLGAYSVYKDAAGISCLVGLCSLFVTYKWPYDYMSYVTPMVMAVTAMCKKVFDTSDDVTLESNLTTSDYTAFSRLAVLLVGGIITKNTINSDTLAAGMKHVSMFRSASQSAVDMVEFIINCFSAVVDYFKGVKPQDKCPQLSVLSVDIRSLLDEFEKDSTPSAARFSRLEAWDVELRTIKNELLRRKDVSALLTYCDSLIKDVNNLRLVFKKVGYDGKGIRQTPIGFIFGGPPGTGKSQAATVLINEVVACVSSLEMLDSLELNPSLGVYNIQKENVYDDSFCGQPVFFLDDFGQLKGTPGTPSDAFTAVRVINNVTTVANFSEAHRKGTMVMAPEAVVASTNLFRFDFAEIVSGEAVARRFPYSFLLVPKKAYLLPNYIENNYSTYRLNTLKVQRDFGEFTTQIYRLIPWDFTSGQRKDGPDVENFDEFIENIAEMVKEHKNKAQQAVDFQRNLMRSALQRRRAAVALEADYTVGDKIRLLVPLLVQAWKAEENIIVKYLESELNTPDDIDKLFSIYYSGDIGLLHQYYVFFCNYSLQVIRNTLSITLSLYDTLYSYGPTIAAFGVGFTCARFLALWIRSYYPALQSSGTLTVKHKKSDKRARSKFKQLKLAKLPKNDEVVPETNMESGIVSIEMIDVVNSILHAAQYDIVLEGHSGSLGVVTAIGGRVLIGPVHFFGGAEAIQASIEEPLVISLINKGSILKKFRIPWSELKDKVFTPPDGTGLCDELCIFVAPKSFPQHKTIIQHFVSQSSSLYNLNSYGGYNPISADLFLWTPLGTSRTSVQVVAKTNVQANNDSFGHSFLLEGVLMYDVSATKKGNCGSALVSVDPRDPCKIMGLHTASNQVVGYSLPLYKEDLQQILTQFPDLSDSFMIDEVSLEFADLKLQEEVGHQYHILARSRNNPRVPTSTSLIPSPLHGRITTPIKAPSDISSSLAWQKARAKYCINDGVYNSALLEDATNLVIAELYVWKTTAETHPTIFSNEDCVRGVRSLPPMNRKSSAGPPYSDYCSRGKRDIFGEEEILLDTPLAREIFKSVDTCEDLLAQNVIPEIICQDYLKDELLPLEKVAISKSRQFSAVTLRANILIERYFGSAVSYFKAHFIQNGMAPGVNPYSTDWHAIYKLAEQHPMKMDGDQSGYDGHQIYHVIVNGAYKVFEAHYVNSTLRERTIRYNLFVSLAQTLHRVTIADEAGRKCSYWIKWFGSNPSGLWLTTWMNTVVHKILIKYCFISSLYGKHHLSYRSGDVNLSLILSNQYDIVFGDDVIISWNDNLIMSQPIMTERMAEIGMEFTDAEKRANPLPFKTSVCDTQLLARGFKKVGAHILAPLKLSIILEMINWTRKGIPWDIFATTVQLALLELSLHGEDDWNLYAPDIIREAGLTMQVRFLYNTYGACLGKIRTLESFY
jgi:hypothetical protein